VSFILDTNICSIHLRRRSGLIHRFVQHSGRLFVPTLVLAELYVWACMRTNSNKALNAIDEMLRLEVQVIGFDEECARKFGELRALLKPIGISVPTVDLMIASVALVNDFSLVTNNTADFCNIPDLHIEDWSKT
jgi:tRNA(fMet)-specific endonuclease VapC